MDIMKFLLRLIISIGLVAIIFIVIKKISGALA